MAHKDPKIIEYNIKLLDCSSVDFYLHIDKKSQLNDYLYLEDIPKYSHVYFVPQFNIYWGGQNQIKAEIALFQAAFEKAYNYYHLISGQDMLVKSRDNFLMFFQEKEKDFLKIGREASGMMLDRVKYYHPISQTGLSRFQIGWRIGHMLVLLQKLFHINRCKVLPIYFGENWCSLTSSFVSFLLSKYEDGFIAKYFYCSGNADELYKQTIYKMWVNLIGSDNHANTSIRYVDWSENKASPKTLQIEDYDKIYSGNYLFARKVTSENGLPRRIFDGLNIK
ncbi:beta-1,6-N-acetylglucosaminyltransferase [Lapidilactobacillus mulanensis]|uniref:Peptide O-xylosyltransferase n=1 Tax=Lapidilactobacillus mulanensis TaxID=2485999 RepID=A0ABW4DN37_9LACO|nr:beta-1,6-N-acetylglucosaminyltransferase [Lapidilactobacillus mulanensis]